jgi:putative membrane protein
MVVHILLMNLLAPMAAVALVRCAILPSCLGRGLALATAAQLALLWSWHAPSAWHVAMEQPVVHLTMQASLALAALWFWSAALGAAESRGWQPLPALLVTSKLFCLLGVLLTFAPRPLYEVAHHGAAPADRLTDQQLAGLMMLVACPATYLLAGVVVAARWLRLFEEDTRSDEGTSVA